MLTMSFQHGPLVFVTESIFSHQPPDVFLAVPFDAVHLILVLLVGCAEIGCFGFVCVLSSYQRLLSLLPGQLLLLDLQDRTYAHQSSFMHTYIM